MRWIYDLLSRILTTLRRRLGRGTDGDDRRSGTVGPERRRSGVDSDEDGNIYPLW